jgi:hypothetical protein
MAYTVKNFKKKKDLVDAVKRGEKVRCCEPGVGPDLSNYTGHVVLEGPHYPEPHMWYAGADLVDGVITKVR